MFALHEILEPDDFTRLVVTSWVIWGARRKAIYKDIFQSPFATNGFIMSYMAEIHQVNNRAQMPAHVSAPRPSHWLPPVQGCVKVNVDVAVSVGGRYGVVGAICRDQNSLFLGASAIGFKYINDPQTLESLAIREAISLSDDLYI